MVVVLRQFEARFTDQYADETVVVDAEYAAIRLRHFVEHLDGLVDETSFDKACDSSSVYEAVRAKTVIHIRANAWQRVGRV